MVRRSFSRIYRLLLLMLVFSVPLVATGQKTSHAVFLGLQLGGSGEAFVDSLERKGYEIQNSSDVCTSLTGLFDGVGCIIEVHTTPKSHTVHQVSVSFVEFGANEVARSLKFNHIKRALKKKYGKWDYDSSSGLHEWSSEYARVSLGHKRIAGQPYKTLYVWWQDREGWERLVEERK